MTPYQKQIVIGTILGGSSLVKPQKGVNYYLSMAGRNKTWLQYKMAELSGFFPRMLVMLDNRTHRCASCCSDQFSEIHEEMYRDGVRRVTPEILEPLKDIALAVWFLDGGGKTGRDKNNAYLNLTRMPESVQEIRDYFCTLDMFCEVNRSKNRIRLVFSVSGTDRLFKTIVPRFPNFMCHRL